jgi:hypothetical protein
MIGQIWEDLDTGRYYDTLPDGTYPIPDDYEGVLGLAPRRVKIVGFPRPDRVLIENLHNGRQTTVQRDSLRPQGKQRGFVMVQNA